MVVVELRTNAFTSAPTANLIIGAFVDRSKLTFIADIKTLLDTNYSTALNVETPQPTTVAASLRDLPFAKAVVVRDVCDLHIIDGTKLCQGTFLGLTNLDFNPTNIQRLRLETWGDG